MTTSQRSDAISFPLRMAGEGEKVKIMSLRGGRSFYDRLSGMGLNEGAEIENKLGDETDSIYVDAV